MSIREPIVEPLIAAVAMVATVTGSALVLVGCHAGVPPSEEQDLTDIIVDAVTVAYGADHDGARPDVRLVGSGRDDLGFAHGFADAPTRLPLPPARTWDVQVFDVLSDDPEEKKLEVIVWDSDLHRQKHGDVFEVTAVRRLAKWEAAATRTGTARGSVIE